MQKIKKIARATATAILTCAFLIFCMYSSQVSQVEQSASQVTADSNISRTLSHAKKRAVTKSRMSAVRIFSPSVDGTALSSMSGTYMSLFGRYYVLTVLHGIAGPCEHVRILTNGEYYQCLSYVTESIEYDYMIMEVERLPGRTPINILTEIEAPASLRKSHSIMSPVYYTGYPNTMGPFTIEGYIIGYDALRVEHVYILSYAWMGASGSGVFGESGKFMGYVLALDVGQTEYGVEILENVVMVGSTQNIDWKPLLKQIYK